MIIGNRNVLDPEGNSLALVVFTISFYLVRCINGIFDLPAFLHPTSPTALRPPQFSSKGSFVPFSSKCTRHISFRWYRLRFRILNKIVELALDFSTSPMILEWYAAVHAIFKFPADNGHVTITYACITSSKSYLGKPSFIHVLPPPLLLFLGSTDVGFFDFQEGYSQFHPVSNFFGIIPLAFPPDNRRYSLMFHYGNFPLKKFKVRIHLVLPFAPVKSRPVPHWLFSPSLQSLNPLFGDSTWNFFIEFNGDNRIVFLRKVETISLHLLNIL